MTLKSSIAASSTGSRNILGGAQSGSDRLADRPRGHGRVPRRPGDFDPAGRLDLSQHPRRDPPPQGSTRGCGVGVRDRAIVLTPQEAAPHENRGLSLQALGLLDEAEAAFRRAVEIHPGAAVAALSHLGQHMARRGGTDEAEQLLRRAPRRRSGRRPWDRPPARRPWVRLPICRRALRPRPSGATVRGPVEFLGDRARLGPGRRMGRRRPSSPHRRAGRYPRRRLRLRSARRPGTADRPQSRGRRSPVAAAGDRRATARLYRAAPGRTPGVPPRRSRAV